jgi:hypothetical protein
MEEWLILQSFYNGLTSSSHAHLGAADLVGKMVSNQGSSEACTRCIHTVKETDMLAAKFDLLLKHMDDQGNPRNPYPGMCKHSTRTIRAKFVAMEDTRGMTTLRPVKNYHS